MNYELNEALAQLVREKSLDKQLVGETLELGLLAAARKRYGPAADIEVKVDIDSGKLDMHLNKKVALRVHDPVIEISLAEAHKIKKSAKCGDTVPVKLTIEDFGRNAIQSVKQVLVQKVREAERERVFTEFQGRIGEIVRGTVQQVDRSCVIVKLDRTEGLLPGKETLPRDKFRHGEYVKSCIITVDKSSKGPQVTLSRTHPDFLRGLFALEVPEVAEGIVEIKCVAREPGNRSKICVISSDEKVDAVGACVGVKGSRVQAVVRELGGERIDIVSWSSDPMVFVTRALSPAKVLEARPGDEERKAEVVVSDDQLSLAIGKGGQNARLAAKLCGWKIDLMSLSQREKVLAEERALRVDIESMEGVGPKMVEKLHKAGVETAQDIEKLGAEGLAEIQGIGEKTASKLVSLAQGAIEQAKTDAEARRRAAEAAAKSDALGATEPGGQVTGETGPGDSQEAAGVTDSEPSGAEATESEDGDADSDAAEVEGDAEKAPEETREKTPEETPEEIPEKTPEEEV
ncbi:MAG: transcription termination factor NusA [Candidatus Eisenbacteria bacterium]